MRFHLILLILTLILSNAGSTLAQAPEQYIAKGNKEQSDGYYQTAIDYYRMALRMDTSILEANFETANAYRKLRNYKRSVDFYEATIDFDGQDQYPEAHFYRALMLKQLGKYRPAVLGFEQFLSMYKARDELYRWARDEEVACYWALEHMRDTARYDVSKPDSGLNSIHAELSPFLWDDQTIFFSSMVYTSDEVRKSKPEFIEPKKAIYRDGKWLTREIHYDYDGKDAHVGNLMISSDSTTVYFSKCAELADCKIYRVKKTAEGWEEAEPLAAPVNVENASSTQPALVLTAEGEYLVFASNRDGGKGGMDLWYVELKDGEPTSRLRNMGNLINSKGDEITPFYTASDSSFYFSSNRWSGYGGFDIFKSKGLLDKIGAPENLGPGINTPSDDYYLMVRTVDSSGYFVSNRLGGMKKAENETCCNDLYRFKVIPPPAPLVQDSLELDSLESDTLLAGPPVEIENPQNLRELQTLLPISLYFHNDRPDPRTSARTTETTYDQTIKEYLGMRFDYIDVINNSHFDGTTKLELGDVIGQFFERDLQGSLSKLDKALNVLLVELEQGASITLAVKGYASPLADSDYNLNLTYRRIASMENYIKTYQNGVFVSYLTSEQLIIEKIPYGESQASQAISDDTNDELGAIYSPKAAKERRIEILRIEKTP
jgi:tetratricopeptide (TPR) repeat protein